MRPSDLQKYLNQINTQSIHKSELNDRGGYITITNAGRGSGTSKSFPLGLDSFIMTLKDILENISVFETEGVYSEDNWRNLAANFSDNAASSLAGTQTKAFFTTLNKLICWANKSAFSDFSDNNILITAERIQTTISALEEIANFYIPKESSSINESQENITIVISEKELKQFAFKSFRLLLDKYGARNILKNITEKDSTINEVPYTALKIKPYFKSGNLIGVFDNEQNRESLSSGGIPRFFEENLSIEDYPYAYFSTQWGDVEDGTLSFNNLQKFITDISNGNFKANKLGDNYSLTESVIFKKTIFQKIYYGAPGTGKSHKIESVLENVPEMQKERVTFHPEYDYSSFVGGYKPCSETTEDGKEIIAYKFVPQVFIYIYVNAWKNLEKDYYLAIEEINRGNCAEIFGDLFQLLDRNSNYSISPSKELQDYLLKALSEGSASKGIEGNKMKLPPNLHILASMNTSDQSLFPMDSAFKRRWSWEYIPITYPENKHDTSSESFKFQVKIDDDNYFLWIDFIKEVNKIIKLSPNLGSDKCLGNYFIKPENLEIPFEDFINKAIFYLWIDVFKDEDESIFHELGRGTTYEDFFPIETHGRELFIKLLSNINVNIQNYKKEDTETIEA
jgi:hypothetical protein